MSTSIVEVNNLIKKYGDVSEVKGIFFDNQEGEVFSLLGLNEAGKMTTLSMLSTFYTPTKVFK